MEARAIAGRPFLQRLPLEEAVGRRAAHDMTQIIPGRSKGPAFKRGQEITAGDVQRLRQMGRREIFVESEDRPGPEWIHEDEAALAFARAMAGQGVVFSEPPSEGKVNFIADRDGLLMVDAARLKKFNMIDGVMCAARQSFSVVAEGKNIAGTRAIPLYLPRPDFEKAVEVLTGEPLLQVLPLRWARVGVLISGTEVFQGLIDDKFLPIIQNKVEKLGSEVAAHVIVADEREAIDRGVKELLEAGIDLLITTAGLSVDPDDVTKLGLVDAGATDMLYGAPILPGAMTLLARIGDVQVMGVPACALYFKTTSLDLLLPRLLANLTVTRDDLAHLGHGAFCLDCRECTFPKCPFGK